MCSFKIFLIVFVYIFNKCKYVCVCVFLNDVNVFVSFISSVVSHDPTRTRQMQIILTENFFFFFLSSYISIHNHNKEQQIKQPKRHTETALFCYVRFVLSSKAFYPLHRCSLRILTYCKRLCFFGAYLMCFGFVVCVCIHVVTLNMI